MVLFYTICVLLFKFERRFEDDINQPGDRNVLRAGKWRPFHLQKAINFKNYFHLKLMSQSQRKLKQLTLHSFWGKLHVEFYQKTKC